MMTPNQFSKHRPKSRGISSVEYPDQGGPSQSSYNFIGSWLGMPGHTSYNNHDDVIKWKHFPRY